MEREEIIARLAEHFNIKPEENGEFDLDTYDWQAGASHNGVWLNLATIVDILSDDEEW